MNAVNKRGRTALLLGCFYRQLDSVKVLLGAGADPTIADEEGFSCLHAAIDGYCSKATLQALIDHGAPVDAARKDGTNALHSACTTGQSESVRFLVEAGADVGITKPDGNTCLHTAVKGACSKEALQNIIEQGMINVNAMNKKGETALLLACKSAQPTIVNLLLQNGADPNISDTRRYTSLHAAVYGCCANETLQEIINHEVQLDYQDIHGNTALLLACSYRQQESVKILLEAGSNPNIVDNNGDTCLHAGVRTGCRKKIIRTIIDHCFDVNATNKKTRTALVVACMFNNEGAIKVLLDAGADPNIADVDGYTCLHDAVTGHYSIEVLQAIIDRGANVNATNKRNETALTRAFTYKNESAINVLLNASADPNIADDTYGDTCLHKAVTRDCSIEVLQAIIDHDAILNATNKTTRTALAVACLFNNEGAIKVLLNAGADPNPADVGGYTCLHDAVTGHYSIKVLQAIIDHGANVNAANMRNETAFMLACMINNESAIKVLLNASADLNIAEVDGYTCLHYAVAKDCSKDVLQAIIDHGANVNAMNKRNETALIRAFTYKNESAIHVLLNSSAYPNIADDTYGDTCLHKAVTRDCSIVVLQALIDHGAIVNATNKKTRTALALACRINNEGAIKVLLNAGADPNIADVYGYTCLHDAVAGQSSIEVFQTIIDHGVVVNATNTRSETALTRACMVNNEGAIKVLLKSNADPNIAEVDGYTCLHNAVTGHCSIDVLQTIIDHGADVNVTNMRNETALLRASDYKNQDAINVLLNRSADPNIADDTYGDTCLHKAVTRDCSIEVLQAIIDHGANVNATNTRNETALTRACMINNEGAIKLLLNACADPDIADVDGYTCLHDAVTGQNSIEVLQTIIDHGAAVNATNTTNETALTRACAFKDEGAVNVLLKAGADPNIVDSTYGDTCLHKAARQECSAHMLQTLIDHGADVNAKNNANRTVLAVACTYKNEGAIKVLINASANSNIADDTYGDTSLHTAVQHECSTEALQAIIDGGASVNTANMRNETALTLACVYNNKSAINVLLNARAEPNIADDNYGDTCLHKAVAGNCSIEVLQAIIDHGANVNATNTRNETALTRACMINNEGAMKVLLNACADPEIADVDGYTCLHYGVTGCCSMELLQAIIEHCTDVNAKNTRNETALTQACAYTNEGAVNVLLKARADPSIVDNTYGDTCLHKAARQKYSADMLQAIIDHGADVDATNKENRTALAVACILKNEGAIKILINASANPNVADNTYGDTSLHTAVQHECSTEALQTIIDHGADTNATNKRNETAFTLACMINNESAIKVLLNAGADSNIADIDGYTCLHYAVARHCSIEVLQAIIDHGANVNATNRRNETALSRACAYKYEGAINVLLKGRADPNIVDNIYGNTCLHDAITGLCSIDALQAIIDHGAYVSVTNRSGVTALMKACQNGIPDVINVLLNAAADVKVVDNFIRACSTYIFYMEDGSIDHCTGVNITNRKKQPILFFLKPPLFAVSILLNSLANPDTAEGDTLLYNTVHNYIGKELHQTVTDLGADLYVVKDESAAARLLACNHSLKESMDAVLRAGADTSTVDVFGDTCLHKILHREISVTRI